MIVRARAGASEQQVRQGVDAIGRAVVQRDFAKPRGSLEAVGLQRELVNDTRPALITLAFAVVFLMLALAVNLASLLLSRAAERERELAIARALGASGTALVRATLLEGVVLGLAGGVAGSAVGWWGIRVLVAIGPLDLPRRESLAMDPAVASVVVAAGLLLGLAAATVPAAWMARLSLGALMTGAGVRGGAVSARLRRGLIVAQVGVSLVLLTAAGLVVQSFNRLLVADPGFQPNGVLTFSVGVDPWIFPDAGAVTAFQDRAEAVLKSIPGVTAVSAANQLPLSGGRNAASVRVPGAPGNTGDSDRDKQVVSRIFTRAGYVGAVGMRLVSGRDFATRFLPDVHEALIDTHLARRFFPAGDPIGATILVGADRLTVVGVVQQARLFHLDRDDGNPQLYVRVEDHRGWRATDYAVRTTGDPRGLMEPVRTAIHQIEPRVSLANMQTLDEIVADKRSRERISALLIGGLALGALLLVSMGIFGVISGAVLRRRGELAVRLALGATHRRVIGLVVGEGARLVIAGALIAAPGIYLAGQALREFLVGVSPFDVPTLAAVTMGLAVVALLACYAAARPVATIEPEQLLRDAG
jgi:putative ABC transport system permease protein